MSWGWTTVPSTPPGTSCPCPTGTMPGFGDQQKHSYLTNCCVSRWLHLNLAYDLHKPSAEHLCCHLWPPPPTPRGSAPAGAGTHIHYRILWSFAGITLMCCRLQMRLNHLPSMKDAFLGDIFNTVFKEHIAQLEMRIHQAIAYIVGAGQ